MDFLARWIGAGGSRRFRLLENESQTGTDAGLWVFLREVVIAYAALSHSEMDQ